MTSRSLSQCLAELNITQSHSRPRTSNDNASVSVRSTNFGSSIPNDLCVDDHKHLPFPTRSGSIDQNFLNKPHQPTRHISRIHK